MNCARQYRRARGVATRAVIVWWLIGLGFGTMLYRELSSNYRTPAVTSTSPPTPPQPTHLSPTKERTTQQYSRGGGGVDIVPDASTTTTLPVTNGARNVEPAGEEPTTWPASSVKRTAETTAKSPRRALFVSTAGGSPPNRRGDAESGEPHGVPRSLVSDTAQCPDWDCRVENHCISTIEGKCFKAPTIDDGGVFKNFQYTPEPGPNRVVPSGGVGGEELRCSWQKQDAVSPPALDMSNWDNETSAAATEEEVHWRNFQHLTGGYFKNWYGIDAPIVKTKGEGSFRFSAGVQGHDEVYVLKNLCVRPNGKLAGYSPSKTWGSKMKKQPKNPQFLGESEWAGYRDYTKYHRPAFNKWLVDDFEELIEEPTWFVDQRLAIYPIVDHVSVNQHSAHYIYRGVQLIHNIAHSFPEPLDRSTSSKLGSQQQVDINSSSKHKNHDGHHGGPPLSMGEPSSVVRGAQEKKNEKEEERHWGRSDFTTLYLRFDGKKAIPRESLLHDTGHWRFTTLATRSHMFAFANFAPKAVLDIWLSRTRQGREFNSNKRQNGSSSKIQTELLLAALNRPVCFREAVFQQACAAGDCQTPAKDPSRDSWTVAGQVKTSRTNRVIAQRLRACAAVDTTFAEKPSGPPRVLFSQRTRDRGLLHRAYLLGELIQLLKTSAPGATLTVAEVTGPRISLPQSVAMMASTDIIIGPHGGGLMYSFVMPEFSSQMVSIQPHPHILGGPSATDSAYSKVGTDHSPTDDFGGMMAALGGHEISVQPEEGNDFRFPSQQMELSVEKLKRSVYSALCFYFTSTTSGDNGHSSNNLSPNNSQLLAELPSLSLDESCKLNPAPFDLEAGMRAAADTQGNALRRSIRAHYNFSARGRSSRRLDQLFEKAANYSKFFYALRQPKYQPPRGKKKQYKKREQPEPKAVQNTNAMVEDAKARGKTLNAATKKLLVVFSLPTTTLKKDDLACRDEGGDREFLKHVQAEMLAIRDHVPYTTKIHVVFIHTDDSHDPQLGDRERGTTCNPSIHQEEQRQEQRHVNASSVAKTVAAAAATTTDNSMMTQMILLKRAMFHVCTKRGVSGDKTLDAIQDCVLCLEPRAGGPGGKQTVPGILCREMFYYKKSSTPSKDGQPHGGPPKSTKGGLGIGPTTDPPLILDSYRSHGASFTILEKTTVTNDYDLAIVDAGVMERHGALIRKAVKKKIKHFPEMSNVQEGAENSNYPRHQEEEAEVGGGGLSLIVLEG